MPPPHPSPRIDQAPAAKRWASRGLLFAWLLYSAGALGWFLAHDPLFSLYLCGAR